MKGGHESFLFPYLALISEFASQMVNFYKLLCRRAIRWSLSGFEPTQVSRVEPDWDLSDALPTELHRRGWCKESYLCFLFQQLKNLRNNSTAVKRMPHNQHCCGFKSSRLLSFLSKFCCVHNSGLSAGCSTVIFLFIKIWITVQPLICERTMGKKSGLWQKNITPS